MYALQPEPERGKRVWFLLVAGALTLVLQGGGLALVNRIEPPKPKPKRESISFNLVTPPKPPPVKAPEPPPAPEPKPEAKPEPKPEAKKVAKRKPRKARKKARAKRKVAKAKPKAAPKPAEAKPAKPKPRLIAGLSLSSTVKGGGGPAFGVGNTAMGRVGDVAADASKVKPAPAGAYEDDEEEEEEAAPPKRLSAKLKRKVVPAYPIKAREANVEGTVVLAISINTRGHVTNTRVIKGLGFGLDEAAVSAAKKTVWIPAKLGARPIKSTRRFNVRFTLEG